MFFSILTFVTALSIEGLATLISVIGLSTFFGANPIIVALAISLDVGKIIVVSLLYKFWKEMSYLMRGYAVAATCITMLITSAGAAGYLTSEFQKAMVGPQEISLRVDALRQEQERLLARKQQIDNQIANLPANFGRTRISVMREFEAEQKRITERLAQLDKEIPALRVEQVTTEAKAGPIVAISEAFNVPVEQAAKWIIGLIVFVFDPLAVFLIVAGNFLWERRQKTEPAQSPPGKPTVAPEVAPKLPDEVPPPRSPDSAPSPVTSNTIEVEVPPTGEKLVQIEEPVKPRDEPEVITRSSLGIVRADPHTVVNNPALYAQEVGLGTGAFTTGRRKE